MNEQELPNLYGMLTTGNVTLLSDSHPRVATTLDHMRHVYRTLREIQTERGYRKLTRSVGRANVFPGHQFSLCVKFLLCAGNFADVMAHSTCISYMHLLS